MKEPRTIYATSVWTILPEETGSEQKQKFKLTRETFEGWTRTGSKSIEVSLDILWDILSDERIYENNPA